MAKDRFPYDLPPTQALVRLIQETHPKFKLKARSVAFEPPFHAPTPQTPGRTLIEVLNKERDVKTTFVYRRLDIGRALQHLTQLRLEGPITPTAIVEEINRSFGMYLTPDDVLFSGHVLAPYGSNLRYRLVTLPHSLVWYGEHVFDVITSEHPSGIRVLENGQPRRLEDGSYRYLD